MSRPVYVKYTAEGSWQACFDSPEGPWGRARNNALSALQEIDPHGSFTSNVRYEALENSMTVFKLVRGVVKVKGARVTVEFS